MEEEGYEDVIERIKYAKRALRKVEKKLRRNGTSEYYPEVWHRNLDELDETIRVLQRLNE